jgi:hypothetical protein
MAIMSSESNSWISFNESQLLLMVVHDLLTTISVDCEPIISLDLDVRLLDIMDDIIRLPIHYYDK